MRNITRCENMRSLFAVLIGIVFLTQALSGAATDLYQVEMIVFSRPGGANEEHSATAAGLRYPMRWTALQEAPANATSVGPWQSLPASARLLNNEQAALVRRGYPILFHSAWRQSVDTATRATSVLVNGGRSASSHRELEGYVRVSAENYLHVGVHLWLSQFATTPGSSESIVLPTPGGAIEGASDAGIDSGSAYIDKLFVLQQSRRVRSGELHYFDHPRFSALVLVKPVE